MFSYENDELVPIQQCIPDQFCRGDVVWMSFMLAYIIGGAEWYPDMRPIDYVKIGHLEKSASVSITLESLPATHLASGKIRVSNDSDSDESDRENVITGE